MITVKDLRKTYDGNKVVLDGVCFEIPRGCVFGLVGINGTGKSTLLRLLAGVLRADSGEIRVDGQISPENEAVKRRVFFLPDDPLCTADSRGSDLAKLYRALYDFDDAVFADCLAAFKLSPDVSVRKFSKGMKRQMFVALALAVSPDYLLLDESFDGLDPLARLVFKRKLTELVKRKGTTVIISSHSLRELEDLCDCYGILDGGKITCSGGAHLGGGKLHKFQAAFESPVSEDIPDFPCISVTRTGRVLQVTVRGDTEETREKLLALNPIFVEEIPMDFEENFIGEAQERGYLL